MVYISCVYFVLMRLIGYLKHQPRQNMLSYLKLGHQFLPHTIARTVLEDICDKLIRIQSYCAVARLHGV
jgi:hypothetical protein